MNDLTIATVNFNTPEYIFALGHSLHKYNTWYVNDLLVFDNSLTNKIPSKRFTPNNNATMNVHHVPDVIYTDINKLPESKYPAAGKYNSARHAKTIMYLMENIQTKYLLLVDSDIVFTTNFMPVYDYFINSGAVLQGYLRTTYHHPCIAPWACWFNLDVIRQNHLKFYDATRMLYINDIVDYDTGASLYEDVHSLGLKCNYTKDNTFYRHFKGGSVFKDKGLQWLRDNINLWW